MPWRVLEHAGRRWNVSLAAERQPSSSQWHLVFSFRDAEPGRRSVWVTYPLSSSSKTTLFAQANRISDQDLIKLLATQLG
jgi:hypothetical protein